MSIGAMVVALVDNGGRRSGINRREFSYTDHTPDRRLSSDRRDANDRRDGKDQRNGLDRRDIVEETKPVTLKSIISRRNGNDRRSIMDRRAAFAAAYAAI